MIAVFLFSFLFSFLGYTPPSVLNMTALKISLNGNRKSLHQFMFGVLCVVLFQAFISIYLIQYISKNQSLIVLLEKVGVLVLLALSVYFYKLNKKEKKGSSTVFKNKQPFVSGILLSSLNMFAIPFFSGIIAFLTTFNLIDFNLRSTVFFISGSVIGTYYILYLYGKYAHKIQEKTGKLTNSINLILSLITASFALLTSIRLAF